MVTVIHYTNNDVNPLNNLKDIKQSHKTMKYRSCRFTRIFTLRSKFGLPCVIICKYDTYRNIRKYWDRKKIINFLGVPILRTTKK